MKLIYLDAETYYAKDYTLRKMTPAEYILDDRFELICVAAQVIEDGHETPTEFIDGPDFAAWLAKHDPRECTVVTYNALFDMCILAWRYNWVPARMVDALGMARALLGHLLRSLSLEKVSEHLSLGVKGKTILNVIGMHRADIIANGLWPEFQEYNKQDVFLLRRVFESLAPDFPPSEFRVMDLVLRCAVEPRFEVDIPLLEQHLADTIANKAKLMQTAGADKADLMSADKFVALLEAEGVDVEYKAGKTGMIPALAKTDEFMASLQEDENPRIQALACARLGIKSTLEESRAARLLAVARAWQRYRGGNALMPIPLRYSGAHTHRLSGDWKMNMQNMTRGGKLRKSLKAPEGCEVIVADLGQIEARLTAVVCKALVLLQAFIDKKDPYALLASDIFGFKVDRKVHLIEGFIGKSGVLGLGFGASAKKFYNMVIRTARSMGMDIVALKKVWTMDLAEKSVATYRRVNKPIPHHWLRLEEILSREWSGFNGIAKFGRCEISHGAVKGPYGLTMRYDVVHPHIQGQERLYRHGGRLHRIYGSAFLENIIQFLARILLMHAALRINDRGYRFVHQAHDELVFIVPKDQVDKAKKIIHEEMTRPPSWLPNLPLTASVSNAASYGEAK